MSAARPLASPMITGSKRTGVAVQLAARAERKFVKMPFAVKLMTLVLAGERLLGRQVVLSCWTADVLGPAEIHRLGECV